MISDMMKHRLFLTAAPLVLLACAVQAPVPVAARLGQQTLQVELSTGSVCSAILTGDAPWRGDMAACGLGYAVVPTAQGNPIRLAFDAMIAALQAGALVAPMADITLTDAQGRTFAFASPVTTGN